MLPVGNDHGGPDNYKLSGENDSLGSVALSVLSFMLQCVRGFEGAQAAGGWQMPRARIKRSKHLMMRLPANE